MEFEPTDEQVLRYQARARVNRVTARAWLRGLPPDAIERLLGLPGCRTTA